MGAAFPNFISTVPTVLYGATKFYILLNYIAVLFYEAKNHRRSQRTNRGKFDTCHPLIVLLSCQESLGRPVWPGPSVPNMVGPFFLISSGCSGAKTFPGDCSRSVWSVCCRFWAPGCRSHPGHDQANPVSWSTCSFHTTKRGKTILWQMCQEMKMVHL